MNARLRRSPRALRIALVSVASLGLVAVGLVTIRARQTALRYELSELNRSERTLRRELDALEIEVATLASPTRIEPLARELGLIHPLPGQVRALEPGQAPVDGAR